MSLELHSMAIDMERSQKAAKLERTRERREALGDDTAPSLPVVIRVERAIGVMLSRAGARLQGLPTMPVVTTTEVQPLPPT